MGVSKSFPSNVIFQEATKITVNTPIHTNTASRLDGSRRTNQNRTANRSRNNGNDGFSTRLVFLSFLIVRSDQMIFVRLARKNQKKSQIFIFRYLDRITVENNQANGGVSNL